MTKAHARLTGVCPDLSARELAMLTLVAGSIGESGVQPTYRQIQQFMGYKSTNSVMGMIQRLLLKGVIWETTGHGFAFDWRAYHQHAYQGNSPCGTVRGKRLRFLKESPAEADHATTT